MCELVTLLDLGVQSRLSLAASYAEGFAWKQSYGEQ